MGIFCGCFCATKAGLSGWVEELKKTWYALQSLRYFYPPALYRKICWSLVWRTSFTQTVVTRMTNLRSHRLDSDVDGAIRIVQCTACSPVNKRQPYLRRISCKVWGAQEREESSVCEMSAPPWGPWFVLKVNSMRFGRIGAGRGGESKFRLSNAAL